MDRTTVLRLVSVGIFGVVCWYTYAEIRKRSPPNQTGFAGLPVNVHPNYFKQLAVQRHKQLQQAIKKINQLDANNQNLQAKLVNQFKQQYQQTIQPMIQNIGQWPVSNYQNVGQVDANQIVNQINQLDDDDLPSASQPYTGVGPGVRKLNITED